MSSIAENLKAVRQRLVSAAERCGRDPAEVRLVAVSKRHPESAIREAYAAGQRDFGESYVQELLDKRAALSDLTDITWHLVGHLQRNKASKIANEVSWVHAVDSARLAEALGRARSDGPPLSVLIQVNLANEPQKFGAPLDGVREVLAAVDQAPALSARGLMVLPPDCDDPRDAAPFFRGLRELAAQLRESSPNPSPEEPRLFELSMGMSDDLEVAVAEGSSQIRIGTAIFGTRPKAEPSP
jgi:pyridoxal phosphate enzyme (YggS family)